MATENDWMTCNLDKRLNDPFVDFKVIFNPAKFKKISFEQASIEVANKIANKYDNLYVSLSGGLDSEYIMLTLYNLKIPFKPIIVLIDEANSLESQYAFYMCKKLNIEPIVLKISEDLFVEAFKKYIFDTLNGEGNNTTQLIIAGKYVEKQNGTLLTGEHVIDDDKYITKASINEWDFYQDYLLKIPCVGLLNYTPEIVYSIVNAFDGTEIQHFKCRLFGINFRPKIKAQFTEQTLIKFKNYWGSKPRPIYSEVLGTKKQFLLRMDSWNI